MDAQRRGWCKWASRHGLDPAPFVTAVGMTAADKIKLFTPDLDAEQEAVEVAVIEEQETAGVAALPGAAAMLALDVPTAVVTSATRGLAEVRMAAAGLALPDVVITAESVRYGKPSPAPYLMAAAELGLGPAQCTVFEDAPAGVVAGLAAGMRVVGVTTTVEEGLLVGADEIVGDLAEYLARHVGAV